MDLLCAACLDSRRCWICDGAGGVDTHRGVRPCPSCAGSLRCQYCLDRAAPSRRAADIAVDVVDLGLDASSTA
jgi:hypothetical protein